MDSLSVLRYNAFRMYVYFGYIDIICRLCDEYFVISTLNIPGDSAMTSDISALKQKAGAGDPASQFELGSHFLKLADSKDGAERDANGKLAITWFIAASKQGNDDATEKLKDLLEDGSTCEFINVFKDLFEILFNFLLHRCIYM